MPCAGLEMAVQRHAARAGGGTARPATKFPAKVWTEVWFAQVPRNRLEVGAVGCRG